MLTSSDACVNAGSTTQCPHPSSNTPADGCSDLREHLVNQRMTGPITQVSIPEANVTSIHGILLDVDLKLLKPKALPEGAAANPVALYEQWLSPILQRDSVLSRAEVRNSGNGLHCILWLNPPVELHHERERQKWAQIIRIVQRLLPTDPDAPGITAMTRPIGSTNAKNNEEVTLLKQGKSIAPDEVVSLVDRAREGLFELVADLLWGQSPITPCPVCNKPDTSLGVTFREGKCYGSCGKVKVGQLFDVFLKPRLQQED